MESETAVLFGQENLPILDSRYTESVEFEVLVRKKKKTHKKSVTEATSGKVLSRQKKNVLCILDKEVLHLKTDKIIPFPVRIFNSESITVMFESLWFKRTVTVVSWNFSDFIYTSSRQLLFQMQICHPDVGKFHA